MNINSYVQGYNGKLSVIDNCTELLKQTDNEKTLNMSRKLVKWVL